MTANLELKPLCSLILERTINDPDKYQEGLTKIFFRAGMLAALESLRSARLNALVTIVQKNMRRRMAVKRYKELRRATIKIQTWWRGILARRLANSIRREVAAIRLQSGVRQFLQRQKFLSVRRGIICFQSGKWHISLLYDASEALNVSSRTRSTSSREVRASPHNIRCGTPPASVPGNVSQLIQLFPR